MPEVSDAKAFAILLLAAAVAGAIVFLWNVHVQPSIDTSLQLQAA